MGARGESILRVGEGEYRLLFTNRALAEAQSAMGRGIIGVLRGFESGTSGVLDTAQLMVAGLEAARRDTRDGRRAAYTLADAYRLMDEVGFSEATKAVVEAIAPVLAYNPDEEEESDAPKAEPTA